MSDPLIKAAFYLSPTLDALWRWSEDGEVLTWPDGTTIAFRAEVEEILKHLGRGGLPPFGAVALLLAACRDSWPDSRGRQTIASYGGAFGGMNVGTHLGREGGCAAQLVFARVARHVGNLITGLDAIHDLPQHLRQSLPVRQILAETVFEGAENRSSIEDATAVLRAIEAGINPELLRPQLSQEESLAQFARQVDGLSNGLARVDAESLARRAKTGLDDAVVAPTQDLSPSERVRRLLAALYGDAELAGVAHLARDLMAAVTIPRTLRLHDALPAGGVSDISNRGPLDRLLVSELAHDDLTLAVRVAVNEALYLRPESPPREPPHRRAILIDLGIRMWGVPRAYAVAAALALVATADPKAQFVVFRATPLGVEPVDLTTRAGIESLLAALEADPHPAGSLEGFYARVRAQDDREADQVDAILITHPDVLCDPDFQPALAYLRQQSTYVATVDRDGSFSLFALTPTGSKPVREAKLALDRILEPNAPSRAPRSNRPALFKGNSTLPSILLVNPCPLLLPARALARTSAVSAKLGLVSATSDGRLLHWADATRGGRQIASELPRGFVRLVHTDDLLGAAFAVITRRRDTVANLVISDVARGHSTVATFELPAADPRHVFIREGVLYCVYRSMVCAFGLTDGRRLATLSPPHAIRWERGRFFRFQGSWHAIAYDGSPTLRLEPIKVPSRTITVFDQAGSEIPFAVLSSGQIVNLQGTWTVNFPQLGEAAFTVVGVSPDGQRIAVRQAGHVRLLQLALDAPNRDRQVDDNFPEELLKPNIFWSTRSGVVPRVHFKGIYVDSESRLSLITRKNGVFHLELDHRDQLALRADFGVREMPNVRVFSMAARNSSHRLPLRIATWADGSIAWLDPRGLLHLKSADPGVPEMSITLANWAPAAWTTEGKLGGPKYFIGDAPAAPGTYFADVLRHFVARVL